MTTASRDWSSHVILSEAKDLTRRTLRSFAEFTLERSEGLRMTSLDVKLTLIVLSTLL